MRSSFDITRLREFEWVSSVLRALHGDADGRSIGNVRIADRFQLKESNSRCTVDAMFESEIRVKERGRIFLREFSCWRAETFKIQQRTWWMNRFFRNSEIYVKEVTTTERGKGQSQRNKTEGLIRRYRASKSPIPHKHECIATRNASYHTIGGYHSIFTVKYLFRKRGGRDCFEHQLRYKDRKRWWFNRETSGYLHKRFKHISQRVCSTFPRRQKLD